MKTFGRDQVLEFLAEIDQLLDEPVPLEIVGGAAALLAWRDVYLSMQASYADIPDELWERVNMDGRVKEGATRLGALWMDDSYCRAARPTTCFIASVTARSPCSSTA